MTASRGFRVKTMGALVQPGPRSGTNRAPQNQTEIVRRVAIYTEQVQRTGRIDWLPHKDTLLSME